MIWTFRWNYRGRLCSKCISGSRIISILSSRILFNFLVLPFDNCSIYWTWSIGGCVSGKWSIFRWWWFNWISIVLYWSFCELMNHFLKSHSILTRKSFNSRLRWLYKPINIDLTFLLLSRLVFNILSHWNGLTIINYTLFNIFRLFNLLGFFIL